MVMINENGSLSPYEENSLDSQTFDEQDEDLEDLWQWRRRVKLNHQKNIWKIKSDVFFCQIYYNGLMCYGIRKKERNRYKWHTMQNQ